MAQFQVSFDYTGSDSFWPGDLVTGVLTVSNKERLNIEKLKTAFIGGAACSWTSGAGDTQAFFSNNKIFFNEHSVLVKSLPGEIISLEPGEHNYSFSYRLPCDIPPSTDFVSYGGKAAIDYAVEVILTRPSEQETKSKFYFIVNKPPVDALLHYPNLLCSQTSVGEKFLCCLCCQSGTITVDLQLEKQVFYVGEPIVFRAEIDNTATNKTLGEVEIRLLKVVTLIGSFGAKEWFFSPASSAVISPKVKPGIKDNWHVVLNIHGDLEPSFDNCACVNVGYCMVLEIKVP